jgi:hypothetical protein
MKKTTLFIIGTGLFVAAIATPVYAQTPATRGAVRLEANVSRLKTRADAEITRRITALNGLITKINAMVRLTSDQKTTFGSGINGQISSLNTLKTKIDADTDIVTLRTDVQSIVTEYRIFVVYLPQVNIMSNADRILALVDEMNAISTKLQTRLGTTTNPLMTDRAAKLADATTQANNAISAVVPLTPSGYPGNKTTMISARTMLQTARQDLVTAEKDATQIRQALK